MAPPSAQPGDRRAGQCQQLRDEQDRADEDQHREEKGQRVDRADDHTLTDRHRLIADAGPHHVGGDEAEHDQWPAEAKLPVGNRSPVEKPAGSDPCDQRGNQQPRPSREKGGGHPLASCLALDVGRGTDETDDQVAHTPTQQCADQDREQQLECSLQGQRGGGHSHRRKQLQLGSSSLDPIRARRPEEADARQEHHGGKREHRGLQGGRLSADPVRDQQQVGLHAEIEVVEMLVQEPGETALDVFVQCNDRLRRPVGVGDGQPVDPDRDLPAVVTQAVQRGEDLGIVLEHFGVDEDGSRREITERAGGEVLLEHAPVRVEVLAVEIPIHRRHLQRDHEVSGFMGLEVEDLYRDLHLVTGPDVEGAGRPLVDVGAITVGPVHQVEMLPKALHSDQLRLGRLSVRRRAGHGHLDPAQEEYRILEDRVACGGRSQHLPVLGQV